MRERAIPFASTTCLNGHSYVETLDAYEDAGLERVELGYCPDTLDMNEIVTSYDFEFAAHNYFRPLDDDFVLNLASRDESIRQRSVSYVCNGIDFCDKHGIDLYTFHAGFRADPNLSLEFPCEVALYDRCFDLFVRSLREVAEYARDTDVELAVENNVVTEENVIEDEPLVLLCEPGECKRLFDSIDPEEIGILLDTGHLNVSAATRGYDPATFVEESAPYLKAFHLHTNNGESDQHRPITPDDSTLDIYQQFPDVVASVEAKFDHASELAAHLDTLVKSYPTA
ncbi:Sugar phosphate isomerase/epimerase [Halopelagius inordinatus]|uniref:Sugar phosphate isomerase/epimerase n=1 Tax=Halopelagius inordinatus TaxID=553467 RepID=A0A1I2PTF2_9EURY|nr:sugar phosphate isomerase/epimerase family protein [Halopelagius inordinatus]SFG17287.1 Sugar phosphate isomerase/epimerase [Halopelagius inordinatus]